jgi:hypothetical protein
MHDSNFAEHFKKVWAAVYHDFTFLGVLKCCV